MQAMTARLGFMMFLQFFIWGAWFVTLGAFLGSVFHASGTEMGLAFGTQSWGAILAPFIIGLVADRYCNAERLLGVIHLCGAGLMFLMFRAPDFATFFPYALAYMVLYMPTLALVNSVSFRQLSDPAGQFGKIRVWGTVGWIVAGLCISFLGWDAQEAVTAGALRNTFLMGSVASLVLGVYSFTLPATPPRPVGNAGSSTGGSLASALGLDALKLLADRHFAVFFASSVLICIPLAFYYQNAALYLTEIGVANPAGKMTLGQMSEVGFMLLLPLFYRRFGLKKTLLLGMAAWVVRYGLFAAAAPTGATGLLLAGIALHGICYDFFFVSGQIYTDAKAGEQYKSSAQGLITLATYGAGMMIGFWAAGKVYDAHAVANGHDWQAIWLQPAAFAAAVLVLFAVLFRDDTRPA